MPVRPPSSPEAHLASTKPTAGALDCVDMPDGASVAVTVVPRASRSRIVGVHGGALKVQLAAPPVDGAANEMLIAVLAKRLGIGKRQVTIVSGLQSRNKRVVVAGVSRAELEALLP